MNTGLPFPNISPVLVEIPLGFITLTIHWYAVAYIAGIVAGFWLIGRTLRKPDLWPGGNAPMDRTDLDDLVTWLIIGIILGGRLGYVLFYEPGHFIENPGDIIKVWQGGMAFHGGFLGVVVAAYLFCRRRNLPVPQIADALALATPPGLFFGRVANFVNAELWGRPTDMPWGFVFPGTLAQNCQGIEGPCARHPSQLYEAGLEGLVLGAVVLWLVYRRGWLKTPGAICGVFLAGYGAARFFVEFFRVADAQFITADNPLGRVILLGDFGLSMGQLLSLPMILVGVTFVVLSRSRS